MNTKLLLLVLTFLSINFYGQIVFEKGYFIDNNGQKTLCLIKNIDWRNNPTEFQYKLSDNDQPKTASIKDVSEFGASNNLKYIRFIGKIDKSNERLEEMSTEKNPEFSDDELFLKVLVEGKASLYMYEEAKFVKFFYKTDKNEIEQLIFKSYKVTDDKVGVNNKFRQQLWNALKCKDITMNIVEAINYKKNELENIFLKYKYCINSDQTNYQEKQKRDLFNFNFRPGINNSSLSVNNINSNSKDVNFDSEYGGRIGIEAEFILPFNKNKWAIILEPTYQYYKSTKEAKLIPYAAIADIAEVDYKSIELPIGVRHYFFLNKNSKIFLNGSIVLDFSNNSKIYYKYSEDIDIRTRVGLAFGLGYNYNNKYSIELRNSSRNILVSYRFWESEYKSLSLILGYTLF